MASGAGSTPYQVAKLTEDEYNTTPVQVPTNNVTGTKTSNSKQQYKPGTFPIVDTFAAKGRELFGEGFQSNAQWRSTVDLLKNTYQVWGFNKDFIREFEKGGTLLGD